MKTYTNATLEILILESQDVITTSAYNLKDGGFGDEYEFEDLF